MWLSNVLMSKHCVIEQPAVYLMCEAAPRFCLSVLMDTRNINLKKEGSQKDNFTVLPLFVEAIGQIPPNLNIVETSLFLLLARPTFLGIPQCLASWFARVHIKTELCVVPFLRGFFTSWPAFTRLGMSLMRCLRHRVTLLAWRDWREHTG